MTIPNKVRVNGVDYAIKRSDELIIINHKECFGDIDYNKKLIRIKNDLQDIQGEEETLLHEIFHAIVYERNFDYSKNDDETITEELARGLYQIVKDNPSLFEGGVMND